MLGIFKLYHKANRTLGANLVDGFGLKKICFTFFGVLGALIDILVKKTKARDEPQKAFSILLGFLVGNLVKWTKARTKSSGTLDIVLHVLAGTLVMSSRRKLKR